MFSTFAQNKLVKGVNFSLRKFLNRGKWSYIFYLKISIRQSFSLQSSSVNCTVEYAVKTSKSLIAKTFNFLQCVRTMCTISQAQSFLCIRSSIFQRIFYSAIHSIRSISCRIMGKFDGGLNLMNLWLIMLASN